MQCSCGGSTVEKVSNTKQEDGGRLVIHWKECTACGRALVTKKEEIDAVQADQGGDAPS